jgi:hypothetical protein
LFFLDSASIRARSVERALSVISRLDPGREKFPPPAKKLVRIGGTLTVPGSTVQEGGWLT